MKITIEFNIDNAAFRNEDGSVNTYEVSQFIWRECSGNSDILFDPKCSEYYNDGIIPLKDTKGNEVGSMSLSSEE